MCYGKIKEHAFNWFFWMVFISIVVGTGVLVGKVSGDTIDPPHSVLFAWGKVSIE